MEHGGRCASSGESRALESHTSTTDATHEAREGAFGVYCVAMYYLCCCLGAS